MTHGQHLSDFLKLEGHSTPLRGVSTSKLADWQAECRCFYVPSRHLHIVQHSLAHGLMPFIAGTGCCRAGVLTNPCLRSPVCQAYCLTTGPALSVTWDALPLLTACMCGATCQAPTAAPGSP